MKKLIAATIVALALASVPLTAFASIPAGVTCKHPGFRNPVCVERSKHPGIREIPPAHSAAAPRAPWWEIAVQSRHWTLGPTVWLPLG